MSEKLSIEEMRALLAQYSPAEVASIVAANDVGETQTNAGLAGKVAGMRAQAADAYQYFLKAAAEIVSARRAEILEKTPPDHRDYVGEQLDAAIRVYTSGYNTLLSDHLDKIDVIVRLQTLNDLALKRS